MPIVLKWWIFHFVCILCLLIFEPYSLRHPPQQSSQMRKVDRSGGKTEERQRDGNWEKMRGKNRDKFEFVRRLVDYDSISHSIYGSATELAFVIVLIYYVNRMCIDFITITKHISIPKYFHSVQQIDRSQYGHSKFILFLCVRGMWWCFGTKD